MVTEVVPPSKSDAALLNTAVAAPVEPAITFDAVMADPLPVTKVAEAPSGTRLAENRPGNVIDMTRWLPKSDVSNSGLLFAAKDEVAKRVVSIKPTGDAHRDAQLIQDAINVASGKEATTISVPPGVYRGNIVFPPNARNITLKGEEVNGRRAVFDMTGMPATENRRAVFTIRDNQNISIEGFEIKNYRSSNKDNPPVGILVTGASDNITIRGNELHHLGLDANGKADRIGSQPILVLGTGGSEVSAIRNLNIANNNLHDINLGQHEGIAINGNVDGFQVSINRLTNLNNIGIDIIGGEGTSRNAAVDVARKGVIRGNFVSGIDTDRNPTYPRGDRSAGGIYVDGGRGIRIETNVVENTNRGIEIGCEHPGHTAQDISVTNNWLRRNHLAAVTVGAGEKTHGATDGVSIINNIFQANGADAKTGIVQQFHVTRLRESGNKFVDQFWIPSK